ncbi:hypothetical protein CCACVL1_29716, partial [Corchorus capsularis]
DQSSPCNRNPVRAIWIAVLLRSGNADNSFRIG